MIVDDFFMFRSRARKSGLILRFVEGQPVILILISQQKRVNYRFFFEFILGFVEGLQTIVSYECFVCICV